MQRRPSYDKASRAAPLLEKPDVEVGCSAGAASRAPLIGMLLVTSAALLFGVVAACVKSILLPTLVLQMCRSVIEWGLGLAAALFYWQRRQPAAQYSAELVCAGGNESAATHAALGAPSDLKELLIGPAHLRGWLFLRALLYWLFLAGWWFALASMPIGDATTIVYIGPVFTALFAYLILGEQIDCSFYGVVVLDAVGLVLITQPTFLFPSSDGSGTSDSSGSSSADHTSGKADGSYYVGALSSLMSAVVAGLLSICTRKSKACFWTAVNHCSSALSALVFTPVAIGIWVWLGADAPAAIAHSMSELFGLPLATELTAAASAGPHAISAEDTVVGPPSFQLVKWLLLFGATFTGEQLSHCSSSATTAVATTYVRTWKGTTRYVSHATQCRDAPPQPLRAYLLTSLPTLLDRFRGSGPADIGLPARGGRACLRDDRARDPVRVHAAALLLPGGDHPARPRRRHPHLPRDDAQPPSQAPVGAQWRVEPRAARRPAPGC